MESVDLKKIIPDTYEKSVYDINYVKLYDSGIKCAIFDVDCTILPFDDINISDRLIELFDLIKEIGITAGLCSSGSGNRVKPVGETLKVKYISNAKKPFYGDFSLVKHSLFDSECEPSNTMMVGDSFYLDMLFAERLGFYKVMVDAVKGGHRIKTLANSIVQTSIYSVLPRDEFTYGKYYHGKRG